MRRLSRTTKTLRCVGCTYLAENGNMCVAGKNMLKPGEMSNHGIGHILKEHGEEQIFKPEACGILSNREWRDLQVIHDTISQESRISVIRKVVEEMGLFTMEELEA